MDVGNFGLKAAVSDSTQGLHWLENGQFGSLGTPHIGISGKWVVLDNPVCVLGMIYGTQFGIGDDNI